MMKRSRSNYQNGISFSLMELCEINIFNLLEGSRSSIFKVNSSPSPTALASLPVLSSTLMATFGGGAVLVTTAVIGALRYVLL